MNYLKNLILAAIGSASFLTSAHATDRVDKIIEQMSLEEKVDFIGGYESFNIRGYPQYNIPEIHMADGPVGVRAHGESMAYPASIALAAGWDTEMASMVGRSIGSEARSKNVHMMLGPGMNIYRMPVCGRNFEYMGEDPYLAGQLAVSYIEGIQKEGVIACAKHFVANNQEFERHHCSSDMDERTLHEIYLPAFKTSVTEGKVASVMTSYNLINGVHASQNSYLIQDVLKGDWEFDGFVVSDWVSTYDGLACAQNGLDIEMPSGAMMNRENLLPALKEGTLTEAALDDKLRRVLNVYERSGLFCMPDISKDYILNQKRIHDTAISAARQGIVLLKNNGILPLDITRIHKIAIIGPNGDPAITGGGGSSLVEPHDAISLLETIKTVLKEKAEVSYHPGVFSTVSLPQSIFQENTFYYYENDEIKPGVEAVFYGNKDLEGTPIATTHYDHLNLVDNQIGDLPEVPSTDFSARFSCFFKPEVSGIYTIGVSGDDGYRLFIEGDKKLEEWRNQGERPSKYQETLIAGREYKIELEYYQAGGGAVIRLGTLKTQEDISPEDYMAEALKIAKDADVVILSVGFNPSTEGEGFDRSFELPDNQDKLITEVNKVNPNTIVVLNSGGNVDMNNWIDGTSALLEAWYPGTLGNIAVGEILLGITNPSGKLPVSFEKKLEDNPCYESYFDSDKDLRVFYKEGIFMGYRYWDKIDKKPRFPFGFGLSYTNFDYSNLKTNQNTYDSNELVTVSIDVTNIGEKAGAEIVQLYVGDSECSLPRPLKELKGFHRQELMAGQTQTVTFELSKDAFSFYNPQTHQWELEPGQFTLYVGASSEDIRGKTTITIN
jgi:beta-glucosidase